MHSNRLRVCDGCGQPIPDYDTMVYGDDGTGYHMGCDLEEVHCEADHREREWAEDETTVLRISERMLAELNEHGKTSSAGQSDVDGLLILEVVGDD